MIHFQCGHCGAKLRVPDTHAGKDGRCPHCKGKIVVPVTSVPEAPMPRPAVKQRGSGKPKACPEDPVLDAAFLDVPRRSETPDPTSSRSPHAHELAPDLQGLAEQAVTETIEPAGESRLPWLVDVFLYPFNLAGIIHLVSLWLLVNLLCPLVMELWGLSPEYVPFVYTLPVAYVVYYLAQCIRDSASGARRAPDFWMSPGDSSKWDCLSESVQVVGCFAVCFWPVSVYYIVREQTDGIYWLLMAGGGLLIPMVLLSVVWFDSYSGLDPRLIVGSMFRTFVPYSVLVLFLGGAALLFVKLGLKTYGFYRPPPLPFVLRLVQLYLLFVAAGLLGRFYQRYKERLNWDV